MPSSSKIVAKRARLYNQERLRADKKLPDAEQLNRQAEALEALILESESTARHSQRAREEHLDREYNNAEEAQLTAWHDYETLQMMTKRLLDACDFHRDKAREIDRETQC